MAPHPSLRRDTIGGCRRSGSDLRLPGAAFGNDSSGAWYATVVGPVERAVQAGPAVSPLDQPGPDRFGRRIDRDPPRCVEHWMLLDVIPGPAPGQVRVARTPAKLHWAIHQKVQSSGNNNCEREPRQHARHAGLLYRSYSKGQVVDPVSVRCS